MVYTCRNGYPLRISFCFHSEKDLSYNFDPLKPYFYIVKLGFTGYTLFFLFLLKNIDCEYSFYQQSILSRKMKKYQFFFFLSENFQFLEVKFSLYLNMCVFVMLTEAVLTSTNNLCFEQKYEKYQSFFLLSENF